MRIKRPVFRGNKCVYRIGVEFAERDALFLNFERGVGYFVSVLVADNYILSCADQLVCVQNCAFGNEKVCKQQ